MERLPRFIGGEFFERKLRRHAVQFRVFDTGLNDWQTHELTFLRVNTGNEEQRTVIAIWNEGGRTEVQEPQSHNLSPIPLRGMVGTVLRCQADAEQTMDIITESMYTLTGYTREEIDREFGGKLLRMIHPDDLDSVVRQGRDHMKTAGRKDYEYRLLRKNAPAVWVLDKTRGYMEKDGQEYLYHVIEENTRNRAVRQQLEETAERYQTAIAQIDGILFEWDAQSDTMHCSERWEKRFGYAPISEHFTAQVTRASHFHPDDLLQLRESVDRMRKYGQDIHLDVRIANLRKKLGLGDEIRTISKAGYRLEERK